MPNEVVEKAFSRDPVSGKLKSKGKLMMRQLYESFLGCAGNWLKSDVVQNARNFTSTRKVGRHVWKKFCELKELHGEAIATDIRTHKIDAGNSWHRPHPDCPEKEAHYCLSFLEGGL